MMGLISVGVIDQTMGLISGGVIDHDRCWVYSDSPFFPATLLNSPIFVVVIGVPKKHKYDY